MSNATKDCCCLAAMEAQDALRVGKFTTRDRTIQALVVLAAFVAMLLSSQQQSAQLDRDLQVCVATLRHELPILRDRMKKLQASFLRTRQMHHQAVGVLDGVRYNHMPPEDALRAVTGGEE